MGQQLARPSPSYKGLCRFFVVRGQNSIWTRRGRRMPHAFRSYP